MKIRRLCTETSRTIIVINVIEATGAWSGEALGDIRRYIRLAIRLE